MVLGTSNHLEIPHKAGQGRAEGVRTQNDVAGRTVSI
jgi:hypothetical protein